MSRAWQAERMLAREEEALSRDYESGALTREEYNAAMRDLQREARAMYEEDVQDAYDRVRDEWGA